MELRVRYSLGLLLLGSLLILSPVGAAIVPVGNVEPDINTWSALNKGYVGRTSDGSLLINSGSVFTSSDVYFGYDSGVTGTATVTGPGSKWNSSSSFSGFLYVGYGGTGILSIEDGGQVSNGFSMIGNSSGSEGTVLVTGANSKWTTNNILYVGSQGSGTLTIQSGGQVNSSMSTLGAVSGSTGVVTVTGVGSKLTSSSDLQVGLAGSGSLTVVDGGEVVTGTLYASFDDLHGDSTIRATRGAILDSDLVFDTTNGNQATLAFGTEGTLHVTAAGGSLGAGYRQSGSLTIKDGISISSINGFLGYQPGSVGTATVTGVGSKWTTTGLLYVGYGGNGDLTVADGAEVVTGTIFSSLDDLHGNGTITATKGAVVDADLIFDAAHGNQTSFSFGNGGSMSVTAATGNLGVGYRQSGNLTVSEGVSISSNIGYLGYHPDSAGSAHVTGAGSKWTNSGSLYVGRYGDGTLMIEDGAQVTSSSDGYLGWGAGTEGSASITSVGSKLTISDELYVGREGDGSLIIEAGGIVSNNTGYLGNNIGTEGTALVTGAGSRWVNNTLFVGGSGSGTLEIEDGGQVTNGTTYVGDALGSTGMLTVTGPSSVFSNSSLGIYVGRFGQGTLLIQEGAQVTGTASIGTTSGSSGIAIVTGAGSKWTTSSTNVRSVNVGSAGNGTLKIEAGGEVVSESGHLGRYSSGIATVEVKGVGSKWTNMFELSVGIDGAANLQVSQGGHVSNREGRIGSGDGSTGLVTVSGISSKWTNSQELIVGNNGHGILKVEAGGQVTNTTGYIGRYAGSSGEVSVTGMSSKWTNAGILYVSNEGSSSLTVTDGGEVEATEIHASGSDLLGNGTITATKGGLVDSDLHFDAAHGNQAITKFGSGGVLKVKADGGNLGVGYRETGSLRVSDGVNISSTLGYLGYDLGSTGTATITGLASGWTNSGKFYVGRDGNGTLRIEAGAEVTDTDAYIGNNVGATGTVLVTGAGSKWTNSGKIFIGYAGFGTLIVEAGGIITNTEGIVGNNSNSTGEVTVKGPGSKWTNSSTLFVNGSVLVENGGQVTNSSAIIGLRADATSVVVVSNQGSKWNTSGLLSVGDNGNGILNVINGGQVSNAVGYVGDDAGSESFATVTGSGSKWTNSNNLLLGRNGSGTLNITSAGLVAVRDILSIDQDLDNNSFINMATGGMLALMGDADDSLTQFLGLVQGTDAVRYWNTASLQWSPLTAAIFGTDYTLSYITTGDLTGYTLLTVGSIGTVGDYDGDGDVDGRDFLILQRNPGLGSVSDWQNAYGNSSLAASSTSVPEPSALVLAIALAAASSFSRRRNFAC